MTADTFASRIRTPRRAAACGALALAALGGLVAAPALLAPSPAVAQTVTLPDFSELAERVSPSVVNIRTMERRSAQGGAEGDPNLEEFFRRFGIPMPQRPSPRGPRGGDEEGPSMQRGVGSGFILSADGFIMTNAHVVDGADEVLVTFTDKRELKARVVGTDRRTDVAVIKVDATGLPAVKVGDVGQLKVGQWVMAIGSPFGLENTVTAGIVSAKQRETGDFLPFIQTDVAVNPGNSGGPLINMRGEVVGINSQIFTTSGAFAGISFAIPIDEAMRVGDQLRASGRVTRGRIGVAIGPVTREVAEGIGLPKPQGALVQRVESGTPAEKAGVEAGDVILRFDGKAIDKESDLPRIVGSTKPGSRVPMQVWRKGRTVDLQVTVAEMEQEQVARRPDQTPRAGTANSLGVAVSDVPADRLKEMRIRSAVRVDSVEGAASRVGVQVGDLILAVNNVEVQNVKQFNDFVSKLDVKRNVVLLIRRGEQSNFIVIRPQDRP